MRAIEIAVNADCAVLEKRLAGSGLFCYNGIKNSEKGSVAGAFRRNGGKPVETAKSKALGKSMPADGCGKSITAGSSVERVARSEAEA